MFIHHVYSLLFTVLQFLSKTPILQPYFRIFKIFPRKNEQKKKKKSKTKKDKQTTNNWDWMQL